MNGLSIHRLDEKVDGFESSQVVAFNAEGLFCGSVNLTFKKRRSACIKELFVRESHRGMGIGSALVDQCCAMAKLNGCETLALSLAKDNREAMGFYAKLGFAFAYEYDGGEAIVTKVL